MIVTVLNEVRKYATPTDRNSVFKFIRRKSCYYHIAQFKYLPDIRRQGLRPMTPLGSKRALYLSNSPHIILDTLDTMIDDDNQVNEIILIEIPEQNLRNVRLYIDLEYTDYVHLKGLRDVEYIPGKDYSEWIGAFETPLAVYTYDTVPAGKFKVLGKVITYDMNSTIELESI